MRLMLPQRFRGLTYLEAFRLLASKLPRYFALLPRWLLFRLFNRRLLGLKEIGEPVQGELNRVLARKEEVLQSLLKLSEGGRILEVGIGEFPELHRMELILANRIQYTGCDFQRVCEAHQLQLKLAGFDVSRIKFASNAVGTYAWTLFDMLVDREMFDLIYLDGHHTFYVDLPAFTLVHHLLRPGGYIMVDDIQWTLMFLKRNMVRRFTTWCYYKDMYSFSDYTLAQLSEPHLKKITEALLLARNGYSLVRDFSTQWWWVLRKPTTTRPETAPTKSDILA